MNELKLIKPDDWHVHVRDGQILATVLPDLARRFARAIIMPNLKPPITTTEAALAYRIRLLSVLPKDLGFEPLMTLYLTDNTTADEIVKALNLPGKRWGPGRGEGHKHSLLEALARA